MNEKPVHKNQNLLNAQDSLRAAMKSIEESAEDRNLKNKLDALVALKEALWAANQFAQRAGLYYAVEHIRNAQNSIEYEMILDHFNDEYHALSRKIKRMMHDHEVDANTSENERWNQPGTKHRETKAMGEAAHKFCTAPACDTPNQLPD